MNNKDPIFLFDLDGTIIKTDHLYYDIWSLILCGYGITLTHELYKEYIQGSDDQTVLRSFGIEKQCPSDLVRSIGDKKDTYIIDHLKELTFVDGAIDFIKNVFEKYPQSISIVTNCNRIVAETVIKFLEDSHGFKVQNIVIGNECSRPKPYPDPYQKAIDYYTKMDRDRDRDRNKDRDSIKVFIFEDSKSGILSGKSVSPDCLIGITTNYSKEELSKYGTDIAIDSYSDLSIDDLLNYHREYNWSNYLEKLLIFNGYKNPKIDIIQNKLKGGFIADVVQVKEQRYNENFVVKLENDDGNNLSNMAKNLELYSREYYFYESISYYVPVNVPDFFGLLKNKDMINIGILMSDLSDIKLGPNLNQEPLEVTLSIIKSFANMHKKFWTSESRGTKGLKKIFPQLKYANEYTAVSRCVFDNYNTFERAQSALNSNSNSNSNSNKWNLSESEQRIVGKIVKNFSKIEEYLCNGNTTLCHGDIKSANMFIDKNNDQIIPYFIDWQYIQIGKATQDLVFFLIESFTIERLNNYYSLLKEYYYIQMTTVSSDDTSKLNYGSMIESITDYSRKDYELDICYAACYFPFFVAMWFGTVDSDELIDKNFPYFFIKKLFNFYRLCNLEKFLDSIDSDNKPV
jgi:beta-phosphoglucomutase-like phosphatase (HAD superfamily)/thiamine kinase-like enzyme